MVQLRPADDFGERELESHKLVLTTSPQLCWNSLGPYVPAQKKLFKTFFCGRAVCVP